MSDDLVALLDTPAVRTIGLAAGVAVVAVWIAAAWWAYENAIRRTGRTGAGFFAAGWILVSTPLLLPLALAIYAVARPGASASDRRLSALAAELVAATTAGPVCPGCHDAVHPSWLRCPACTTWLAVPCAACGEWSPDGLEICPYCAADAWGRPTAIAPELEPQLELELEPEPEPQLQIAGHGRRSRHAGRSVRRRVARSFIAGHETAAAGELPAAAGAARSQRDRFISSARPRSYAASRESSSASS